MNGSLKRMSSAYATTRGIRDKLTGSSMRRKKRRKNRRRRRSLILNTHEMQLSSLAVPDSQSKTGAVDQKVLLEAAKGLNWKEAFVPKLTATPVRLILTLAA